MKRKGKKTNRKPFAPKKFISIIISLLFIPALFLYSTSKSPVNPGPTGVIIKDYKFLPQFLKVKAGSPLVFINRDSVIHNVYGNADTEGNEPILIPNLKKDEGKMMITPKTPGLYRFHCHLHPEMRFNLRVE